MKVNVSTRHWVGRITISDPVSLLREIARRYETLERVIMEYVDNSIDDADDMARDNDGNYPYRIKITIIIDREYKRVIIHDNCRGMNFDTLSIIIHKIGGSTKRACPWLNGQFGFGVHAFRGFCKEIIFHTKNWQDQHYALKIHGNRMDVREPTVREDKFRSDSGTGTTVILQAFDEDYFEGLTAEIIKEEIETHFETLLKKENITIKVGYKGEELLICEAFDYSKIPGKTFRETEKVIYKNSTYSVEIFLKVADIPVPLPRRVRFFAKGRRISFAKDDKSFINKTKYRMLVWDHSNMMGYVEVGNLVNPVITRDGFQRGKNRSLLYDAILRYEDDVKDAIDEINRKYEDHSLNKLEDVIAKALRKLAREDALRFKVDYVAGNGDITLAEGGGSAITEEVGGPSGLGGANGMGPSSGEGDMDGPSGEDLGILQGFGEGGPLPQPGISKYSGIRRKSSGFSLRFVNIPPDAEGIIFRSQFSNGTININMGHPDFRDRIERTRKGELKITQRMISYVAAVISIHYKDQYYEKYHNQPDQRTDLFDQQVEFIFRLEKTLFPFLKEIKDIIVVSEEEN